MKLDAIQTSVIQKNDNIADILLQHCNLEDRDILAISSKIIAIAEGAAIDLDTLEISKEAQEWSEKLHRTKPNPAFRQAILNETSRMNGYVHSSCPEAMLCELKPDGLTEGSILAVNAGLDHSNIQEGFAIGWPIDCIASIKRLQKEIQSMSGKTVGVILTDSCCRPRRLGVSALALTVAGLEPLASQIGKTDLQGRQLLMTFEATADQLATAANFLMGNADQCIPAVRISDHGIKLSNFCGWVPGIAPEEDLFQGIL